MMEIAEKVAHRQKTQLQIPVGTTLRVLSWLSTVALAVTLYIAIKDWILIGPLGISLLFACGVVKGAALAWNVKDKPVGFDRSSSERSSSDARRIQELEERLAALETINAYERRLEERSPREGS